VRIITATNEDLTAMVRKGTFREDLYHRLNEFDIHVPPLRQRGDDLLQFINLFRRAANEDLGRSTQGFDERVLTIFRKYHWPGNLRELRNVVKRAVLFTAGDVITMEAIPTEMIDAISEHHTRDREPADEYNLKHQQESQEREMIIKTLLHSGNNKAKAARLLHIDRKTLYLKIKKYEIE
jgi:two-component system response regulator HydG